MEDEAPAAAPAAQQSVSPAQVLTLTFNTLRL